MNLYYYYRDRKNRPMVSVCLKTTDGVITRGLAVCSEKDNPCKSAGRKIACERARQAFERGDDCLKLNRDEAFTVLYSTDFFSDHGLTLWVFKGRYNPMLTPFEEKLIRRVT